MCDFYGGKLSGNCPNYDWHTAMRRKSVLSSTPFLIGERQSIRFFIRQTFNFWQSCRAVLA
jgi:hypothetical protein